MRVIANRRLTAPLAPTIEIVQAAEPPHAGYQCAQAGTVDEVDHAEVEQKLGMPALDPAGDFLPELRSLAGIDAGTAHMNDQQISVAFLFHLHVTPPAQRGQFNSTHPLFIRQ
jgi:hypothetical protein